MLIKCYNYDSEEFSIYDEHKEEDTSLDKYIDNDGLCDICAEEIDFQQTNQSIKNIY